MPDEPLELAMTTTPVVDLSELDILWVSVRDAIARQGTLRYGGKTYFFRSVRGQVAYPAEYLMYELSPKETKVELGLQDEYYKLVDENSEYVGNMRVSGGMIHGSSNHVAYYNLLENPAIKPTRSYWTRTPAASFTATL